MDSGTPASIQGHPITYSGGSIMGSSAPASIQGHPITYSGTKNLVSPTLCFSSVICIYTILSIKGVLAAAVVRFCIEAFRPGNSCLAPIFSLLSSLSVYSFSKPSWRCMRVCNVTMRWLRKLWNARLSIETCTLAATLTLILLTGKLILSLLVQAEVSWTLVHQHPSRDIQSLIRAAV